MPNEVSLTLTPRQTCDLELLLNGGFAPLTTFLSQADYNSVVETMHLATGQLWPIPVVLDVFSLDGIELGTTIFLCDDYGRQLASLTVSEIYQPNKEHEAQHIYGTTDRTHFGVKYLLEKTGNYYLSGELKQIHPIEHFDFTEYRFTPQQLKHLIAEKNYERVIAFQTRNPIHKAHFHLLQSAAQQHQGLILINPAVGETKDGDIHYLTRVRSYIKLRTNYFKDRSMLALLPLAMRLAGPREAVWHALIRKNYGCTHFIVGRDHASPGKNQAGVPFYEPLAAQQLAKSLESEIGLEILAFPEIVYVQEKGFIPAHEVQSDHTVCSISGTQFRQMIRQGQPIPEWFSFPEVIEEIRKGIEKETQKGVTIFFTGLSSAGKSTLARMLYYKLLELQDKEITLLDGDIVRKHISYGLGFSKEDRNRNILRIGFVAKEITRHGGIAICAAIAPYEESRHQNRQAISAVGNYVEVYVSTPVEECMARDVKGLYKKAQIGAVKDFTAVSDPYEVPHQPELTINTTGQDPELLVHQIVDYLLAHNLIRLHHV